MRKLKENDEMTRGFICIERANSISLSVEEKNVREPLQVLGQCYIYMTRVHYRLTGKNKRNTWVHNYILGQPNIINSK